MDLLTSLLDGAWLTDEQSLGQILNKTIAILEDPRRWTIEAQARDQHNRKVHIDDPTAVSFSIEGALALASNDIGVVPPPVLRILDQEMLDYCGFERRAVAGIMEERDLGWYNDAYTHDDILTFMRTMSAKYNP
jgi:hypothetical protein